MEEKKSTTVETEYCCKDLSILQKKNSTFTPPNFLNLCGKALQKVVTQEYERSKMAEIKC